MQAQYFTRDGRRIPKHQAVDARGVIRDGVVMRTRMMLRDSTPRLRFTDARKFWGAERDRLLVTDVDATNTNGNRPGWRIADSAINRQARAEAY